jgi:hypothetical protein
MLSRIMTPIVVYGWMVLSGCSIAMALNGHPEPNFDTFEVGSTRKQVEIQLGTPISSAPLSDGQREDTYHYEMGNSPNGARATLYFYYDLVFLGLSEPIFTLIEAFQGHKEESKIVYSADDRVLDIQGYRPPPPSPELKAAQEAQEQYKKSLSSENKSVPSTSDSN